MGVRDFFSRIFATANEAPEGLNSVTPKSLLQSRNEVPEPVLKIDSLGFDTLDWRLVGSDDAPRQWITSDHDLITLEFEQKHPWPEFAPSNIEEGREFFRSLTAAIGQGFIELDHHQLCSAEGNRFIVKVKQDPTGVAYLGTLSFYFDNCGWICNAKCLEHGVTGMREAMVVNEKLQAGEIRPDRQNDQMVMVGWCRDPYDPEIVPHWGYNLAEDPVYDQRFPNHPLSRLRRILDHIAKTVKLDCPIDKIRPYDHRPFVQSK